MIRTATIAALALAAPTALAQTVDLTVDSSQSSVSAEICITPPGIGTECDTDGSSIVGDLEIELDNYDAPGAISIYDFVLALQNDLSYNMDWGPFVGGINIDLTGVVVQYPTPGIPTGPVGVDGAGDFEFPVIPALVSGTGDYEGYGLIMGGLVGSGSFNLADFGVVDSAIAGNVVVIGSQIILAGSQAFYGEGEISGVETSIDGSALLIASGEVPPCRVDINEDGQVNTQDFIVFLNFWSGRDAAADWNDDGNINTQDFIAFLNDWVDGC